MAFIVDNGLIISFAEFSDLEARDQRVVENNESLTDDVVEDLLIRATERILSKIRSSSWWVDYYLSQTSVSIRSKADIPAVDPEKILDRQNDFTDLCVYTALSDFILPLVADFGNEDDAERAKMGYYSNKSEELLRELLNAGDWYDFDGDSSVESAEKKPGKVNLKRVR